MRVRDQINFLTSAMMRGNEQTGKLNYGKLTDPVKIKIKKLSFQNLKRLQRKFYGVFHSLSFNQTFYIGQNPERSESKIRE